APVAQSGWDGNQTTHVAISSGAAALAAVVGLMALVRYYTRPTATFLLVAVGFLGAAVLDLSHIAVTAGWLPWTGPADEATTAWTWSTSRIYLGVMLGAAFFAGRGRVGWLVDERVVYGVAALLLAAGVAASASVALPDVIRDDGPVHRPQGLIAAVLFAAAL